MSSLNLTPLSINNPQPKQSTFFDRLGTGIIDNFGGWGAKNINTALTEPNPIKAGISLTSGLVKTAADYATFVPRGIFNTTKDFATEVFKPGQSNLSKTIDAGLHTSSGNSGLDQGNNLANGFLNGLGQTVPFLALFGDVMNGDTLKAVNNKRTQIGENLINKESGSIDQKLGLEKNTKLAQNQRAKVAATGSKTPGQVLTENKIPLDNNAVPTLDEHIVARQATKQALLQTEGKWGNFDDLATEAKKNLTSTGTDRNAAIRIIDQETAAYKAQFKGQGQVVDGKLMLPLDQIDKIKSAIYNRSYGNGLTLSDALKNKTLRTFGSSLKTGIENTTESDFVKLLNRQEGDFINAKKLLLDKNVEALNKPSSLPTRLTRKVVGAVIGSSGGPMGSAIGAEVADYVGEILSNRDIPSAMRNIIIDNLRNDPVGETVLQKAQATIRQRLQDQIKTPQIEGPKTIFAGPRTQTETPMKVEDARRTTVRNPNTGQMKRQYLTSPKKSVK